MPKPQRPRRPFYVLLCLCVLLLASSVHASDQWRHPIPDVTAQGAVLLDLKTGQILYTKQANEKFYPASTTKIMTALVALERGRLDDIVTISETAVDVEGSLAYFAVGENLPLRDVLHGLMLMSGNDAALAIAEHVGGSETAFANLMNQKARALGLENTHFMNPHGLHDPDHYTTPLDLARLARHAMLNDEFSKIVATQTYELSGPQPREMQNSNQLLWADQGITGIKTGFTPEANSTFVGSAKQGEQHLVATVMDTGTQEKWEDALALLTYGFEAFQPKSILTRGATVAQVSITGGTMASVPVIAADSVSVLVARENAEPGPYVLSPGDFEVRPEVVEELLAPLMTGTSAGRATIVAANQTLGQTTLLTAAAVPTSTLLTQAQSWSMPSIQWSWWYPPMLLYAIWRTHVAIRRRRRKRARLGSVPSGPGTLPVHRLIRGHGD